MSTGYAARPRIGDEIVFNRGVEGKERRWRVTSVKGGKQVVSEARDPASKVAELRAAMGEEWGSRYWTALLRSEGGAVVWMTVLDVGRYGGEVESFHREL